MNGFRATLTCATLQLTGGGAAAVGTPSQSVPLVIGKTYEVRCSQIVFVRKGSSDPRTTDIQVRPDTPLVFVADENQLTLAAGTLDAVAWVREEVSHAPF